MLPIERLRELLKYDPETGLLTWSVRRNNSVPEGAPAFTATKDSGHKHGLISRKCYMAHRVAWAIHYGQWPQGAIDHVNGIRDDNRIANLRVVDAAQNAMNRRPNARKASALPHGVSVKKNGRFFAQIQHEGKNRHLGYFATAADAEEAYKDAAREMGFHENHGLRAYRSIQP